MSIRGIDVSDYQPNVDWQAVAREGILFSFVKATEGGTFVSQTFARNWAAMKVAGIQRGAYHFFRPASSVQAQIDLFLKTVKLEPGDLPAVLDIETTGGLSATQLCDRATIWLAAVEKATLMRPIIYTYPGFWDKLATTRFADYPLWIAHYTAAEQPWIPGGWKSWTFWQYSDSGSVPGVAGNCDVNIFESVREGALSQKVGDIQKLLKIKGFYSGAIDGLFAASTKAALISFQKSKNLAPDGVAGLKTWAALMRKSPDAVVPTPTPAPPRSGCGPTAASPRGSCARPGRPCSTRSRPPAACERRDRCAPSASRGRAGGAWPGEVGPFYIEGATPNDTLVANAACQAQLPDLRALVLAVDDCDPAPARHHH